MSILSQIIAYAPNKIDTETKARAMVQGPQNMANGGQLIGKPGGIVEPGIKYYGKTTRVAPNIYKTEAGTYEVLYKKQPQVTKKTFKKAKDYLKSIQTPHAQTGVKKSEQHKQATSAGASKVQQGARLEWIKKNPQAFEQMEWISKNGTKYTDPNKMISAFEKKFGYKDFRKADIFKAFKLKPDGSSRINTSFLRESDVYKLIGSDATNPYYISFTKGKTEGEIFKASILQQNKAVQKDMIKAFELLGEDMGKYIDKAKFNTVDDALKLLGKKEYAVLKNFFGFDQDGVTQYSGVGRSATRSTMQRLGIDNDVINNFHYVRHPIFNVREIVRNLGNDSYRKLWNLSKADATRIINGWKKVEQGYSGANQWIKSVDDIIGEGKFKKIFGNTQFDHTLTKTFGEGYKNVPKDLLLKGKYTSEAFNKLKSSIFDQPLVGLVNKYDKASAADKPGIQKQINNLFKEFNTRTGGHVKEWKPDFTNNKLTFKTSAQPFSDVGRYINTNLAAKEMKQATLGMKNLGVGAGQYEYSKGQLKNIKNFQAKQDKLKTMLADLGCPKSLQKASGGRIKYGKGTSCPAKGREIIENGLKNGFKNKNQQVLAEGILKAGRGLRSMFSLSNLFGPAALGFTVAAEAGIVGYDMLASGKSFREVIGDSLFNYLLGDKTKIDSDEEFIKRLKNITVGPQGYQRMSDEQIGKMLNFKANIDDMHRGFDLFRQKEDLDGVIETKKPDELGADRFADIAPKKQMIKTGKILDNQTNQAIDSSFFPDESFQLDAKRDKLMADIQDYNRTNTPNRVTDFMLSPEAKKGADATALAELLVEQDQLKDAGTKNFLPKIDQGIARNLKQTKYDIDNLLNPKKLDAFGEFFISRPQSEQSYMMGLGYREGGIASLNVNKK